MSRNPREDHMEIIYLMIVFIVPIAAVGFIASAVGTSDRTIAIVMGITAVVMLMVYTVYAIATLGNAASSVIDAIATVETYRASLTPTPVP